uniref:Predicted protein n=1 Tax=Hordeum vulgare subsp. vulgare TaxID=112509 RepID=F2DA24_HORVV|nr:predicted protein [Hordeum vulgare subsp. vulgare]
MHVLTPLDVLLKHNLGAFMLKCHFSF